MTPLVVLALVMQVDPAAQITSIGDRAAAAYEAGDYQSALALYQQSFALLSDLPERRGELGVATFLIASCLEKLERYAESLEGFRRAGALPLPEALRERVARKIEELQVTLRGRIEVRCEWPYARLRVGDGPEQPCTEALVLDAGRYVVVATQPDGSTTRHEVEVFPRSATSLVIPRRGATLAEVSPAPPPVDRTWIWATTIGAATLVVGGVAALGVGRAELASADQSFSRANDETLSNAVRLQARDETLAADRRADRATIAGWTAGGLGVALGVVAVFLWIDDLDDAPAVIRW